VSGFVKGAAIKRVPSHAKFDIRGPEAADDISTFDRLEAI
jgi:hypothetical protein